MNIHDFFIDMSPDDINLEMLSNEITMELSCWRQMFLLQDDCVVGRDCWRLIREANILDNLCADHRAICWVAIYRQMMVFYFG